MKIIPVAVGELDTFESDVFAGGDKQKKVLFYSYVFIIIVDGQAILVDASFGDFDYCKKNGPNECRLLNNDILDMLKDNGYNAEDIKTIVLTHCHWDHIGGLSQFPNATIYCQKEEYEYALANSTPDSGEYPLSFKKYLVEDRERFNLIDGDYQLNSKVKLIKTGGHSVGSQIIEVENDDELALILGDEVFSYDNIIKKMPVGCTKNPEKSAEVLDKIISRIANTNKKIMVYPGHDPRIISQFDEMNTLIKP